MLQNASYMFFLKTKKKTKRLRKKKNFSHCKSRTRDFGRVREMHYPLRHSTMLNKPRDKLFKMVQKRLTYDETSTTKGHP